MADFDPFANQGGPAAWDPEHTDDSKAQADELLNKVGEESGAEPGDFGGDDQAQDAIEDEQ
ncbi:MAG: hypothetical protein ABIW36_06505 [Terrimesophilobacter sp.]